MRVMVTGGAGYIGAHVVRLLRQRGDEVLVVDDLSTGSADRIPGTEVVRLDVAHRSTPEVLAADLDRWGAQAVIHLAARKSVAESVERPLWYHEQNVTGLAHVLDAVRRAGVERFVFSSSAAVYGATDVERVRETDRTAPVNPYGETKLAGEWLLRAAGRAWGLRHVSLRYFNVAGAGTPELGDRAVANLVTLVLDRWSRGEPALVLGTDYPTPDGSGIRDYVHVQDLASAHLAALDRLDRQDSPDVGGDVLNIGTGSGASVLEVLAALADAAGDRAGSVEPGPRRVGDPACVVADPSLAHEVLGWRAESGLAEIARSAWAAHTAAAGARTT